MKRERRRRRIWRGLGRIEGGDGGVEEKEEKEWKEEKENLEWRRRVERVGEDESARKMKGESKKCISRLRKLDKEIRRRGGKEKKEEKER